MIGNGYKGRQFSEDSALVKRAIGSLEGELNKEENKTFIRQNSQHALLMGNILNKLSSKLGLCVQKNFDYLKANLQHLKSIDDILSCFSDEMRIQGNFDTLFENASDLDEINKEVGKTAPIAGGVCTVDEIDQTRFDEIISEIKKQKTSRPALV